jgi:hypothetical protein
MGVAHRLFRKWMNSASLKGLVIGNIGGYIFEAGLKLGG